MTKTKKKIPGLKITEMQLQYMHNGFDCGYGKFRDKKAYTRKQKHKQFYF